MKKTIYLLLLLVTCFACKKDEPVAENESIPEDEPVVEVTTGEFTDTRDGHVYKWVEIGDQVWMAENLAYDSGAGCWPYDYEESNVANYGNLYTWEAAQAACPSGWHLPSDAEWEQLVQFINEQKGPYTKRESFDWWNGIGKHLKATGSLEDGNGLWHKDDEDENTNDYGFSALPGGWRHNYGYFTEINTSAYWWSATEKANSYAYCRSMFYTSDKLQRDSIIKSFGFSVRCVKD